MTREEEALNIWEHSKGVIEVLTSYPMGVWLHRRDKRVIGKILDKIRAEIEDTLYVDSLIFGELIDFKDGKISADDVIEEFNRVTRNEVLQIIDEYKVKSEE